MNDCKFAYSKYWENVLGHIDCSNPFWNYETLSIGICPHNTEEERRKCKYFIEDENPRK